MSAETPPGWYPDPERPGTQRWWDGEAWGTPVAQAQPGPPVTAAAPAPAGIPSESRTWAMVAHLSALVAAFVALAFLGPLVVYLVRQNDPFAREQAAEALNFQLSALLYGFIGGFVLVVLLVVTLGLAVLAIIPILVAAAVAWLVLIIVAAAKANRGVAYRYPLTLRFVR